MLRFALVGCDSNAASRYVQACKRFRDISIVAASCEDPTQRTAIAHNLGEANTESNFRELLQRMGGQFDAVIIDSALDRRSVDVSLAAAAHKHVLVASPIAPSMAVVREVLAACSASEIQVMLAGTTRLRPSLIAIKQALDAGKLGVPALLRCQAWRPRSDGANNLWSLLVEKMDLVKWFFGALPVDVLAVARPAEPADGEPGYLQVQLGFPSDGMALVSLANLIPQSSPYDCTSLIGSSGATYLDAHEQTQLLYRTGHPQGIVTEEGIAATVNEIREIRDAISQKRKPIATGEDAVAAMLMAEAVMNSARLSQPFELHGGSTQTPEFRARGHEGSGMKRVADLQNLRSTEPMAPTRRTSPDTQLPTGDRVLRVAVLSVIKHDYVARGVASHPRFELVVVADDPDVPDWVHQRNQQFADEKRISYVRDVERALKDFKIDVAVVSSEAERHCDLSVRAANLGVHVIQDKPMSNRLTECDRLIEAVERNRVTFSMWNRNMLPAVVQATELVRAGVVGKVVAINADFYFSKDAGPPKGSRKSGDPLIDWLEFQRAAHIDGSDGAVGKSPIGELQNEGIYPLAYIRQITGGRFLRAYAKTAAAFHQVNVDNNVEDLGTVTLEMNDGMIATLAIGRIGAASHPDLGEIKLWIVGTEGSLVIAEARPEVAIHYRGQPEKEFRRRRVAIDNDFLIMDNFARALDGQDTPILDARTSREITAVIQAALRSAKSGRFEFIG